MPIFRMEDGSFINAPTYKEARQQYLAARQAAAPAPVPAARAAPPAVTVNPVLTPADNFAGRSMIRFGIGEQIGLSFTSTPPGRTAASFGGLNWFVVSGPATVANDPGNNGIGTLTCGERDGAVELELRTAAVPATVKASKRLQVVRPTDALMVRAPGTGIYHRQGTASVGFKGHIYLRPIDVSFIGTEFREGAAPYEATGCFEQAEVDFAELGRRHHVIHPVLGDWVPVLGGGPQGCRVDGEDTVRSHTLPPPFESGTFTWNIPWFCRVVGSGKEIRVTTATHKHEVDNQGRMSISKKGVNDVARNAQDPDSNY